MFVVKCGKEQLVVDPGSLTSVASLSAAAGTHVVAVTHRHPDHCHVENLRRIGAPIVGPAEVAKIAHDAGLLAAALIVGKPVVLGEFRLTALLAEHGPAVKQACENVGLVIEAGGHRIFYTGDVAGLQPKPPEGPFDLVLLPISPAPFVFDPKDAAEFLVTLGHAGPVVPLHTDDLNGAGSKFAAECPASVTPRLLAIGQAITL